MANRKTTPTNHTRNKRQLAALATLLGLMQTASKLSAELDALANEVGGCWRRLRRRLAFPSSTFITPT
jgi:hypothetical protein